MHSNYNEAGTDTPPLTAGLERGVDCNPLSVGGAVLRRRSIRAFLPEPIPRADLEDLLIQALRAPTGGNIQPYHVYILTGAALNALSQAVQGRMASGDKDPGAHPSYPRDLNDDFIRRRNECGEELYRALAIAREDRAGRRVQFARNARFFEAPVGLIFTLDYHSTPSQWVDLGILLQSIMLLASERGWGTCAQAFWSHWPNTVSNTLDIPADQIVAVGMALGFPDEQAPANGCRTSREALDKMVTWRGADS